MTFWQRLLSSSDPLANYRTQPQTSDYLANKFWRAWKTLEIIYQSTILASEEISDITSQQIIAHINSIALVLSNAERPEKCVVYAFEHDIFAALMRIGKLTNSKIKKQVIVCLSQLLDANDDEFVGRNIVLNCFNNIALHYSPDPEYDENLVYLLFSISTLVKANSSLLHKLIENESYQIAPRKFSKEKSPTFHALLNYAHFDGATGDFARTGILNFVEVLVKEPQLQDWVENSGLPEVMAAGLGALFSQLTRQLAVFPQENNISTLQILFSEEEVAPADFTACDNPYFLEKLYSFSAYLSFWKDVLRCCKADGAQNALLNNLLKHFLEQLLYPSLLASSNEDCVALLTYLRLILQNFQQQDLCTMILNYLFALKSESSSIKRSSCAVTNVSTQELGSPVLFTLKDLIMQNILSTHIEVVVATLKLVTTLLSNCCHLISETLLLTQTIEDQVPDNLDADLEFLENVCPRGITPESQQINDNLAEMQLKLESHSCCNLSALSSDVNIHDEVSVGESMLQVAAHLAKIKFRTLRCHDPLLQIIAGYMKDFFTNSITLNFALTEVIIELCLCPYRSIHGWLLPSHATPINVKDVSLGDVLLDLNSQIIDYEDEIDNLQIELTNRRNALFFVETLDQAMTMPYPHNTRMEPRLENEETPKPANLRFPLESPKKGSSPFRDHYERSSQSIPSKSSRLFASSDFTCTPIEEPSSQSEAKQPEGSTSTTTVSHILNNIIVYQKFVEELTCVFHVRYAHRIAKDEAMAACRSYEP